MKKMCKFGAGILMGLSLLVAALPASVTVQADEVESADGIYEYEVLDDGTIMLTKYHGDGGAIEFPDTVDSYYVSDVKRSLFNSGSDMPVSISVSEENEYFTVIDGALYKKDPLTLVCYPRGMEQTEFSVAEGTIKIGNGALWWCKNLTSISIPDTVTVLGDSSISNCLGLTEITIPDSVVTIEDWALSSNTGIAEITIPDSVTEFGREVFTCCKSLTAIHVSENQPVLSVRDSVLFNKDQTTLLCYPAGLTAESYTVPESVTRIEKGAFRYCEAIKTVIIPDTVVEFGNVVFESSDQVTLVVGENSSARNYAAENGIPYVLQ